MPDVDQIKSTIKAFILEEFLPGESPDDLTDTTELMTLGVLDSVSIMRLVTYLEGEFGVSFDANELSIDYMNTLPDMSKLVASKL